MWCSQCGATVPEGSQFCGQCGRAVAGATIAPGTPPPPPQPFVPAPTAPTSSKAVASLITGIFGLIFFLPAIAAIILGHMSRSEIRRSGGRLQGDGLAIAGLVMGYGSFVLAIPIVLIIAAIAIPNLLRARMAADESSAVASVRTINIAQSSYQQTYPEVGYACMLASLDGAGASGSSSEHAQLIDDKLGLGEKSGYRFQLQNCINTETEHKYLLVAYPSRRNQTGIRTFCSDESGVIKVGEGESAEECLANGSPLE